MRFLNVVNVRLVCLVVAIVLSAPVINGSDRAVPCNRKVLQHVRRVESGGSET